ncbi:MAG: transglycosylase family protein [Candidatus Limnocylindrales bacterium]|nr:transglycosylase family protein [Candidatus Limnocylindrales bacterium]
MRVQAVRRPAVVVATLATALVLGVIGAAPTRAADPPDLERFMTAVARVESGGNHKAVNRTSGAYGRYQILPENWRAWAQRYLGNANAKPTPANQEKVAKAKMRSLYRWLGSWRRVSYWWLTGSSRTKAWSRPATSYVARVMAYFGGPNTGDPADGGAATAASQRYSERSSTIDYSGSWRPARHGGYAGGAVRYAISAGATATITFTGSRIAWYGPVGPTRGKARISIDGVAVKTVNLKRSSFESTTILYSASWKTLGRHTLAIEVIGTPGHRLVAIDELVVTK